MRKILFIALLLTSISSQSQTLFTYGANKVDKKEFWRAFTKNNTGATDEKAIREYLDLFIRFKLKVQAAKDARLDTLPSIKNDVAGFRAQLVEQYMRNQSATKDLTTEAFERSKTEIEVAHVFVAYDKDSAKAKVQIDKAYQQLQGGADFAKTAKEFSTNPFVQKANGYIGYVSVFSLPYEMENVLYASAPGSYSKPIAGANGFHILKVMSKRNALGKLKAAQILVALPANASPQEQADAKAKADMIVAKLKKGEKFEAMAAAYSEDKLTYMSEGVLPEFTYTKYDAAFSKAAFGLQKDGDISEPVLTGNGYHIIKRISLSPITDSPEYMQRLSETIGNDARMNIAIAKMKQEMMRVSGYKAFLYNEKELWVLTDTTLRSKNYASFFKANKQKTLFQLTNKKVSVADWLQYAKSQQTAGAPFSHADYKTMMKQFTETTAEQYYKDRMELMNEDFRYQVKEFSEGSMLFEIMERTIWSKAPLDSAGLMNYYNKNKSKYKWQPSVTAIVFNCSDTAIANQAYGMMKKDPSKWKDYMETFGGNALADSSRFEYGQLPVSNQSDLKSGTLTPVVTNPNDGSSSFCFILQNFPGNDQRSFEEARGLVINDYQLLLEEQWMNQLKKKYPVKVNDAVVKGMVK
jgi:peptidyl-prolyl cis-trans isomerase SurA